MSNTIYVDDDFEPVSREQATMAISAGEEIVLLQRSNVRKAAGRGNPNHDSDGKFGSGSGAQPIEKDARGFVADGDANAYVKQQTSNPKSAAYGGIKPDAETLKEAWHITSPEAAARILDSGFKSSQLLDPALAEESYKGNGEDDGGDFVYFGSSEDGAGEMAVSSGVAIRVDLSNQAGKTVYHPEQEGGLLMTYKNASRFSIREVKALDGSKEALAVVSKWRKELMPTIDQIGRNKMKADTGAWITRNGKRIHIEGGGGDSPAAAEPTTPETGGLTHEQRQKIALKIADKLGLDPNKVRVADEDDVNAAGEPLLGKVDAASDELTVYPAAFMSRDEFIGTMAHEGMHQKFNDVLRQYNRQQNDFQHGEPLTGEHMEVFRELRPVFQEANRAAYMNANGQSNYDKRFWESYKSDPSTPNYVLAVSETLAEVERLTQAGRGDQLNQQWFRLRSNVNRFSQRGVTR